MTDFQAASDLEAYALPHDDDGAWLFSIGIGEQFPRVEGLVDVDEYKASGRPPEEVAMIYKARSYGARAVFFEAGRNGRAAVAQAFIFDADSSDAEAEANFADKHKRLWSWGGVPLVYRVSPGLIQMFRCTHRPDFLDQSSKPVFRPHDVLQIATEIAAQDRPWWSAARLRNGTIWDDPRACEDLLSRDEAAHRKLAAAVRDLDTKLSEQRLISPDLHRKLLILSLLIAYLEDRTVLGPEDFGRVLPGADCFFNVLGNGDALIQLLEALQKRFNGHVFRLTDDERTALSDTAEEDLREYARFVEGYADANGQTNLWKLYSFADLPVELISSIYQLFVTDVSTAVYTPPALVRLILEEALGWERLDRLMETDGVILDPACGSGVFLVEAYKRLVLHWRYRNDWARPDEKTLRQLLERVHGIDLEKGAVELAAFSLCLALCDALEPEEIRQSVQLFPGVLDKTIHQSCFFEAIDNGVFQVPIAVIVGNPPFKGAMETDGAKRRYAEYNKAHSRVHGKLPDKQVGYLFLNDAMEVLAEGGVLAMIQPVGFLYNLKVDKFRKRFFTRWKTREILDFTSVRGLFRNGGADPKILVVVTEARAPDKNDRLLHAVFRRSGRAFAELGFDIDHYDLHWIEQGEALASQHVWRANLVGGSRVRALVVRLSEEFQTLKSYVNDRGWTYGVGYIRGGAKKARNADHIIGRPLLPYSAMAAREIQEDLIKLVPNEPIEGPRTAQLFSPPLLLIKREEDLPHALWKRSFLAFKQRIVGIAAPASDVSRLEAVYHWLDNESAALQLYLAATSVELFGQRATAIMKADIDALPFSEDGDLGLSQNERIVAEDVVDYMRDFVRRGANAAVMKSVPDHALSDFHDVFTGQISAIYRQTGFRALGQYRLDGTVCAAYGFGEGAADWSGAEELRGRLDALLREQRPSGLQITRIARVYDRRFIMLLKPDLHRFWLRSIALRDADDVLADLRGQGF